MITIHRGDTPCERACASRNGWKSLKLIKAGKRRGRAKGNWWMGWSTNEKRFARNHDAMLGRRGNAERIRIPRRVAAVAGEEIFGGRVRQWPACKATQRAS
jgi:hypothetical protein